MRHISFASLALLTLAGCEPGVSVVDGDSPEATNYQTDKSLAKPAEVAVTLRARATLDALVDPGLFKVTEHPHLNGVVEGCTSESVAAIEPVYRESDCSGLTGWGFEVLFDDCILDDDEHINGTMFFSYAGLNDGLSADADSREVLALTEAVLTGMGPDLAVKYEGHFMGDGGGALDVCGEYSGRVDQRYQREVVDVWVNSPLGDANHVSGRMLWNGTSARMDAESPEAYELLDGRIQAQFPAGATADPYTFDVRGVARKLDNTVPTSGAFTQRGWDRELRVIIDQSTAETRQVHVDDGQHGVSIDLPRW